MLNKLFSQPLGKAVTRVLEVFHPWLFKTLGRDRLEYIASNTTNELTQKIDPFIWTYACKAKVISIRQETVNTKTFVLLPNQNFKAPIAGQHIELTSIGANKQASRCYTLSEITPNTVSITVKLNPEGEVSPWLHNQAEVGTVFDISLPRGNFVHRNQDKLLFICAGSGITPAFSMINNLLNCSNKAGEANKATPQVGLFYRTQTPENTIFSRRLVQLQANHDNIKIELSYSRLPVDIVTPSYIDQLMSAYPDIKQQHIYLCGPELFRNDVIQYLESIDFDFDHLDVEQFTLPVIEGSQGGNDNAVLEGDVTVILKSQNINFVIPARDCHKTLLEAAEEQGIVMEHGCRSGMCGSCKTNLVSGEVRGNKIGRSIYPCTAYPASKQIVLQ
ncbi:MAG: iron-sulfur cluster-binding domain-containing protein [Oleispira antarctica]|uniref:Oxidoreductase FAD-binding domain protein n=1 Tax=Oleispira antarctica RB-8 TaxID=698738 RepID=R4YT84_OLEAN|nr:iron-sulfur cluster-binding domain-containing protein [Oleispira antarctica]MBQ0792126.1 iron-sulfur cluster-binding domain-containing protein [Oleispira antarctica]CCK75559.1 Oxidoreductase FAD-binding domain protein [Oleispira antarctica RB-8]